MVEQNEADGGAIRPDEDLQRQFAPGGGSRLVAETSDGFLENAALGWIVIDDQDDLGLLAGYSTQLAYRRRGARRPNFGQLATQALLGSPKTAASR